MKNSGFDGTAKYLTHKHELRLNFEDQIDQRTYRHIAKGLFCEQESLSPNMKENYQYFIGRLCEESTVFSQHQGVDWLRKIILVQVKLPSNMAPQRIFERMNGSKLEVSQLDLIKNFLLMQAKDNNVEEIVYRIWEQNLKGKDWEFQSLLKMYFQKYKINLYKDFKLFYKEQNPSDLIQFVKQIKKLFKDFRSIYVTFNSSENITYQKLRPWNFATFLMFLVSIQDIDEATNNFKLLLNRVLWWCLQSRLYCQMHVRNWDYSFSQSLIKSFLKDDEIISGHTLNNLPCLVNSKSEFYKLLKKDINEIELRQSIEAWQNDPQHSKYMVSHLRLNDLINEKVSVDEIISRLKAEFNIDCLNEDIS